MPRPASRTREQSRPCAPRAAKPSACTRSCRADCNLSLHRQHGLAALGTGEEHLATLDGGVAREEPDEPRVLALDAARVLLDPVGNLVDELVLPEPLRAGVVRHQGVVAAAEPALEPAEVADGEPHVDHRILPRLVVVASDVGLTGADPGERGRHDLDETAGTALARRLHVEAALARHHGEGEERGAN